MKKLMAISLLASAFMVGGATGAASAKPVNATAVRAASAAPAALQRWRRPARVRIVTRTVRQGRHLYRVTYRITTFPNGRTASQMIRRVMIR